MATVTRVTLSCDLCGDAEDVKTRAFGLDGKAYEIDLCRKDGTALERVAARYAAKARKTSTRPARRPRSDRAAGVRQQKGVYVYGILPEDIEVTDDTPGVGEHPGLLRDVRSGGLAALISDVNMSDPLGSPEDLRTYREILDAIAAEVPVVPLRFGTILTSEDAVAQELLAARHDEFTAALDRLEGRAEFQVKGRYVKDTGLEKVSAWREQDARTVQQALEGVCVASVTRQPTSDLDAVDVAFLVNVSDERRMERVTRALSRKWEGRVDLQLLGPMAAYDFTVAAQPESGSGLVRLSGKSILASGSGLSPCSCRLLSRWFDLAGMGGLVPWRSAEARAGLAAWRRGELSPWHHNHLRSREPLCWK